MPAYHRATSIVDAATRLGDPKARVLAGGTDLVPALRDEVVHAEMLVDVARLPETGSIEWRADGSVRIGASVSIQHLADDLRIKEEFPALAQAAAVVGSPALRNMGTLGGNLCQRPRCWYFRQNFPCYKHGGTTCFAVSGENQYHAILGGGPCFIVHPSDCAVALLALDATVLIASASGERAMAIEEFFVLPRERMETETVLGPGELVTAVELPAVSAGGRQRYDKTIQRGAWDFALVSLATVKRRDGAVRFALGGVAPVPWRVTSSVEEDVASGGLGDDDIMTLAERALYDASPLSGNAYKVEIAAALLRRGMGFIRE